MNGLKSTLNFTLVPNRAQKRPAPPHPSFGKKRRTNKQNKINKTILHKIDLIQGLSNIKASKPHAVSILQVLQ
jgi:hypothetical protein